MRASERDRQQVVEPVRAGLEDGRLTMEEYSPGWSRTTRRDLRRFVPLHAYCLARAPRPARGNPQDPAAARPVPPRTRDGPADGAQGDVDDRWSSVRQPVCGSCQRDPRTTWPTRGQLWVDGPSGDPAGRLSAAVMQAGQAAAAR